MCKQAVENHGCNPETLVKSQLAQSYLQELLKAEKDTPAEKKFYDYYALWIISKRLKDMNTSSKIEMLTSRLVPGKNLRKASDDDSPRDEGEEGILRLCEDELFKVYKECIKRNKGASGENLEDLVLGERRLLDTQKKIKDVLKCLDAYNDSLLQAGLLKIAIEAVTPLKGS